MDNQFPGSIDPEEILEILGRNVWVIFFPVVAGILIAVGVFFYLPKLYKSTTVIMVEKQQVPEDFVKSSVKGGIGVQLNTIRQQILRRDLLIKVIEEFSLYSNSPEETTMEELADRMREKIEIEVNKGGRMVDAFTISYTGKEPETVMNVTNRISSLFIEDNLRSREEFVEGTSEFLTNELAEVEKDLEIQEDAIRKFRQQYMGELPEQTGVNLRKLDRLQIELQAIEESLSKSMERRSILIDQNFQSGEFVQMNILEDPSLLSPRELKLARLEAELLELRNQFTDKYPDIVQIKKEIALLKEAGNERGSNAADASGSAGQENSANPELRVGVDYSEEFRQLEIGIQQLTQKQTRVKDQIDEYERRVDSAPLREQTLLTLKRDYENTKRHYQSLLTKKLNARISENLEKKQKGEKFRILDPAGFPTKPFSPNLFKIILFGLIGGAGFGGGLTYLRESMDTSFRKVEEIQGVLNHPVLASIPNLNKM